MIPSKWTAILIVGVMLLAVGAAATASAPLPADGGPTADQPGVGAGSADEGERAARPTAAQSAAVVAYLTVFMLAIFVGFEVITKVPPTLHTPLMSGSNAISGITIIGALILAGAIDAGRPGTAASHLAKIMAFIAVIFAAINVVGGFLVTDRMLRMFRRR